MTAVASRRPTGLARGPALLLLGLLSLVVSLLPGCRDNETQRFELQGSILEHGYHLTLYVDSRDASDLGKVDVLQAAIQSELVHLEGADSAFSDQLQRLTDVVAALPVGRASPGPRLQALYRGLVHAWLIDQLAEHLDGLAVAHYFLEVGGAVRVSGEQAGGRPWRLALEHPQSVSTPLDQQGSAAWLLPLEHHALVSAGDFRDRWHGFAGRAETPASWWLNNGRARILEVSVVGEHALEAAAWAAWLKRLVPDEAQMVAEQRSIAAYFIVTESMGYDIRTTSAMDLLLAHSTYRSE